MDAERRVTMNIYSKNRRTAAVILCFLFIAALMLSMAYIVKDSRHECIGGDCPVCAQLELVQKTIDQLGTALILLLFIGTALFTLCISSYYFYTETIPNTPVRQNVRMNN